MTHEMTDKQKELFDKLTPLNQEVALNSLSGMSDIDSYRNSRGKAKTVTAQESGAHEILRKREVVDFMDSMKAVAVNNAIMSREEMLERLSGLARTNMNDLIEWDSQTVTGEDGEPMIQSMWQIKSSALQNPLQAASISEVTAGKDGIKIKQHSPLQAMKMLSDMQGFNAPIKTEQSGTIATVQMSKEEYAETRRKMMEEDDC